MFAVENSKSVLACIAKCIIKYLINQKLNWVKRSKRNSLKYTS